MCTFVTQFIIYSSILLQMLMTLNIQTHINDTAGQLISILSENIIFELINGKKKKKST